MIEPIPKVSLISIFIHACSSYHQKLLFITYWPCTLIWKQLLVVFLGTYFSSKDNFFQSMFFIIMCKQKPHQVITKPKFFKFCQVFKFCMIHMYVEFVCTNDVFIWLLQTFGNPNWGATNFDNLPYAMLTIFQVCSHASCIEQHYVLPTFLHMIPISCKYGPHIYLHCPNII